MDFSWEEKQLAAREAAVAFARDRLADDGLVARDRDSVFSREQWKQCADFGIQSLGVPEAFGGRGEVDLLTAALTMEGLGYGCRDNGLTFGLNAQVWTVQLPITHFGTDEQKQRILPKMCSGEWIGAHALTEPATGSDVYALETSAEKVEGGYRLTGKKRLVTLGPEADLFLVFATVNPEVGKWGITAFLVERDTPGLSVGVNCEKMGLRTVPFSEVTFDRCLLPDSARLGKEGGGFSISNHSLEYERCGILASQVGAMEHQLEEAVGFAKSRQQFGQPVGKFQSVSNRIADMALRLETAKLLLYKVAWMKDNDQPAMLEAAMAKLHLAECFVESGLDAIRTQGGVGYLSENGVERDLRDAIGGVIYAGTSDIQRNIIASLLGL